MTEEDNSTCSEVTCSQDQDFDISCDVRPDQVN